MIFAALWLGAGALGTHIAVKRSHQKWGENIYGLTVYVLALAGPINLFAAAAVA